MPFKSEKQRRYLHANHPEIAKRWEKEYSNGGILDIDGSEEITRGSKCVGGGTIVETLEKAPSVEKCWKQTWPARVQLVGDFFQLFY